MFGIDDGTFEKKIKYPVGRVPSKIIAGDFNNDEKIDPAVTNIDENTIEILLGNGDGTFQNRTVYRSGEPPNFIVSGGLNGDRMLDLAVVDGRSNTLTVFISSCT